MKTCRIGITFFLCWLTFSAAAQSDACNSATSMDLSSGSACESGTTVGATSENIMYDVCNANPVNEVWYTYTVNGSQNDFQVTPGSLTDPELVVYTGGCPGNGGTLETCATATGGNTLNTSWGLPAGTQVWVGVASNEGTEGTFDLCIDSYSSSSNGGNGCSGGIPYCDETSSPSFNDMSGFTSSGATPSCFGGTPQQDMWITFTVTQDGTIEWTGAPQNNTEFDWALWDISNGNCPGTEVSCNYNYAMANGTNFGMGNGQPTDEYNASVNATAGETYAIQIDNYSGDGNGFDFSWGGTAVLSPNVDFSISPSGVICANSVTVQITDNSSAEDQQWDFGDGTTYTGSNPPDHTYSSPGVYAITSISGDTSACIDQQTEFVELYGPLSAEDSTKPDYCGSCIGEGYILPDGGSGQYSYSWSPGGQTTPSVNGLCDGSYDVTITDDVCGTSITQTVVVDSLGGPTDMTFNITPSSCSGSDGEVDITGVTDGGAPYEYDFDGSGFSTQTTYTGLAPGTYPVTVRDTNGCIFTKDAVVNTPNGPTAISFDVFPDTCEAGVGEVSITGVTGGTSPYDYSFDGSAFSTQTTYSGLASGTYTVSVQDDNGCQYDTSAVVNATPPITAMDLDSLDETCSNSNGSVWVSSITGGTSPYQYEINGNGFGTADSFGGLAAGSHTVTVQDQYGCTFSSTISITNLTGPTDLTFNVTNATCGASDGSVDITGATGGNGSYEYDFDGGGYSTQTTYTNLSSGTYSVTVQDTNGCTYTESVSVSDAGGPAGVTVNISPDTCQNGVGEVEITGVSGGASPYDYSFNGSAFSTQSVYGGLTAGTYPVSVMDDNGCQYDTSVTVGGLPPITDFSYDSINETCTASNGSIWVTGITGGTSPYEYEINGNGFSATDSFPGLSAGTHTITVRDQYGCSFSQSISIIDFSGPTAFSTDITSATCGNSNGQVDITGVTDGTSPYEYDFNGSGFTTQTSYTGLAAGTYGITVRDSNGCTFTDSVTVNNIPGPSDISFSVINATCGDPNGEIQITGVTGGSSPYEYDFNGGGYSTQTTYSNLSAGTYTVIVRDTNGCTYSDDTTLTNTNAVTISGVNTTDVTCNGDCDGSLDINISGGSTPIEYSIDNGANYQTNATFNAQCAGTYDIVVRDSAGCTDSTQAVILQPDPMGFDTVISDLACYQDGSGEIEFDAITGGDGSYQFSIDGGGNYQADSVFSGLSTGTYDLIALDGNGCGDSIQATVQEPPELVINFLGTDSASCFGTCDGSVSAFPAGGTVSGQYKFYWSNNIGDTTEAQPSNVCAGSYSLIVEDDNGCTVDTSFSVGEPTPLQAWTGSAAAHCYQNDGLAYVDSVDGGTDPYSYSWGSSANNQTGDTATNLAPGTYQVTVTDGNGCDTTIDATVGNTPGVTASLDNVDDALCYDSCDGSATVTAGNGTTPYSYLWDDPNAQTTDQATGLCAGTYECVVTDSAGCTDTVSVTVNEPQEVQIQTSSDDTVCVDGSTNISAQNPSGGMPGYTYHWDQGLGTGQTIAVSPDVTTTYEVYAEDANGCVSQAKTVTITVRDSLSVTALSDDTICPGDSVSISAQAAGGDGNYSYSWNPGGAYTQTTTVAPSSDMMYTVTLDDGCSSPSVTDEVMIRLYNVPKPTLTGTELSGCVPIRSALVNTTNSSMVGNSCVWDFGDGTTGQDCDSIYHQYSAPGRYDVSLSVTSPDGCVGDTTYEEYVHVYSYPVADFDFGPQPTTIQDPEIEFKNLSLNAVDYSWTIGEFDTSAVEHPTYTFPSDGAGVYPVCLKATSSYGCVDTTCRKVVIDGEFVIFVPNAFSPNGDGVNEEFYPEVQGHEPSEYTFKVFNRWGEMVFESHHEDNRWDGTVGGRMAKEDTYVWKVMVVDKFTGEKKELEGHVTIIR